MARYTDGTEFSLLSKTPYKGKYNIGPDGKKYTGKDYQFGVSRQLIELENSTDELKDSLIIEYDELKSSYSEYDFVTLKSYFPEPTDDDYGQKKIIKRYFARKANNDNSQIVEIDEKQYQKISTANYYNYIQLNWMISGEDIAEYNIQQTSDAEEEFVRIEKYLSNPMQLTIRKRDDII